MLYAQHLSVSSMTDEEPGHLVPLLLTGVVQGGVAILVLGMQPSLMLYLSWYYLTSKVSSARNEVVSSLYLAVHYGLVGGQEQAHHPSVSWS